ncbi:MAG: hypothetical protein M3R67_02075 [Acidobacteriota bacterium]|nr:hypothetical protein [Acidobacteriota bacterium]
MLKKTFALMLSGILLFVAFGLQSARAQTPADAQRADKARVKIQRTGLGREARVEVKLLNNTKLKGYVSSANQDSFTVTDPKSGSLTTVAYADVAQVKKPGSGLSPLTWGIIAGAAAAAIIVGITVIKPVVCDGGAGC